MRAGALGVAPCRRGGVLHVVGPPWWSLYRGSARPLCGGELGDERRLVDHADAEPFGLLELAARGCAGHNRVRLAAHARAGIASERPDARLGVGPAQAVKGSGDDPGLAAPRPAAASRTLGSDARG